MLIALVLGIAIPAGILFLREFFKYKIEGHEDVLKLTQIPVIADITVASDAAKKEGKADIVVHQNVNMILLKNASSLLAAFSISAPVETLPPTLKLKRLLKNRLANLKL